MDLDDLERKSQHFKEQTQYLINIEQPIFFFRNFRLSYLIQLLTGCSSKMCFPNPSREFRCYQRNTCVQFKSSCDYQYGCPVWIEQVMDRKTNEITHTSFLKTLFFNHQPTQRKVNQNQSWEPCAAAAIEILLFFQKFGNLTSFLENCSQSSPLGIL